MSPGSGGHKPRVIVVGLGDVGGAPGARDACLAIVPQQVGGGPRLGPRQHVDSRHHRGRGPALARELTAVICREKHI